MANPVSNENAEAIARDLATELASPFCPGRSIASCSSSPARAVEREMVQMTKEGKTREEIESVLMARFGEEKLGTPFRGDVIFGVSLAGILAVALVVLKARSWVRQNPESAVDKDAKAPESTISEADRDRLEAELDRLSQ